MSDTDETPLKELIIQALENCQDSLLLDLVYKLIIYNTP
jgi:hypothetical protein